MSEEIKIDPSAILDQNVSEATAPPKVFDRKHRMHHPDDDDVPLMCLKGMSNGDIMLIIGVRCSELATFIRNTGCSLNEARKLRREQQAEKRQLRKMLQQQPHPDLHRDARKERAVPPPLPEPVEDVETRLRIAHDYLRYLFPETTVESSVRTTMVDGRPGPMTCEFHFEFP